jgi:hypothetical protein
MAIADEDESDGEEMDKPLSTSPAAPAGGEKVDKWFIWGTQSATCRTRRNVSTVEGANVKMLGRFVANAWTCRDNLSVVAQADKNSITADALGAEEMLCELS